ncbi:MAG TPA: hypothetical protein VIK28_03800 [Sedimentisphaerales bacterium]
MSRQSGCPVEIVIGAQALHKKDSTKALVLIACFLGGILFMKGLSAYYDFNWATALAAE